MSTRYNPHSWLKNKKTKVATFLLLITSLGGLLAMQLSGNGGASAAVGTLPAQNNVTADQSVTNSPTPPTTATGSFLGINSQSAASNAATSVSVNGQSMPVPKNGNIHRVIQNGDSTTVVDISTQDNTSTNGTRVNSSQVNVNSRGQSSVQTRQSTEVIGGSVR